MNGGIAKRLKQTINQAAIDRSAEIIELEIRPDHVHLLIALDPQYGIHRFVKGLLSRILRCEFLELRSRLPTLWTNSYFVATV